MSWASHPTAEMPEPIGPSSRRRIGVVAVAAATVLVVLIVVGAIVVPKLLSQPTPSEPAGALGATAGSAGEPEQPQATATVTPSGATAGPTQTTITAPSATRLPAAGIESLEAEVLDLTNTERAKKGCAALRSDSKLQTVARNHSAEMAGSKTLTHTGADGSDPGARMKAAGYNLSGGWAENVASGYPTPTAVMTGWMNSDAHRANIVNCALKAVGVGAARATNGQLYWTQDFGGR